MADRRFAPGEAVVRRELWRGRPWLGVMTRVVEDREGLLALYLPEGASFDFPDGDWPGGRHPWHGRGAWEGHGVLQLQRPGEAHAVWLFWEGPERRLACWYVNLQAPFRRTPAGIDTWDHELDLVVLPDGAWSRKDEHLLDERVREGRFLRSEAEAIRTEGARVEALLGRGERWWDGRWAAWAPPPEWGPAPLPDGWDEASPLETGRLALRPLEPEDRGWYAGTTDGDAAAAAKELADDAAHRRAHGFGHHAVTLRSSGEPVGVVELHLAGEGIGGIDPDEVEIGWLILEPHRGCGYATEAAAAVVAHARHVLGIERLVAYVRPGNAASFAVAAATGLRERGEGRTRSGHPCVVLELAQEAP